VPLEDFALREKIFHFDNERVPERVLHARGLAAHGYFELTDRFSDLTTALVLNKVGERTPVFTRFSIVAGNRGSADPARDVQGSLQARVGLGARATCADGLLDVNWAARQCRPAPLISSLDVGAHARRNVRVYEADQQTSPTN
jgi:hypothetical protein